VIIELRLTKYWESTGFLEIRLDKEVGESDIPAHHVRLDTANDGSRRTRPSPGNQLIDVVGVTLGKELNPPVFQIAHPANQPQRSRNTPTTLPIAHHLNPSTDENVDSSLSHEIGISGRSGLSGTEPQSARLVFHRYHRVDSHAHKPLDR